MIKTQINPTTSATASTNIPIQLVVNTNSKTRLNANAIELLESGLWDVKANIVVTATTTGNVTAKLLANGVPVIGALDNQTVASGDEYTYHINDVVRAIPSADGFVELAIQFDQAVTTLGGDFIVEYVR